MIPGSDVSQGETPRKRMVPGAPHRYGPSSRLRSEEGSWPWILQRFSGLAIMAVLFLHLWIKHFGNPGKEITFERSSQLLHRPFWLVVALLMIGLLLFHSLNGGRNVLMDYVTGYRARRVMLWASVGTGVIFLFVYVWFLGPFVRS
ncbi:MAG: succinate dehydrogenase, hydrophobic membrane anchor protein [Chloroflexi bacterium]|nr:succinate dehydrogenase, hydrophobic membrane anchor protein [Chloroflexota bacterium]